MKSAAAQLPRTGPRPSGAIVLYAIGLAAFFIPWFVWPSSPIDPVAIGLNILIFSLTLYSAYRGQTVVAFFNSVCLFFISYPFLLQYAQGVDLSEHGYVRPLSLLTASVYALYLVIITIVGTKALDRTVERRAPYRVGPTGILLVYSVLLAGAFTVLFGTEVIFGSRYQQYLDANKAEGTAVFLRETLRITPYWVAYLVAVSAVNKGRSPVSLAFLACFLVGFFLCNPVNSARFYSLTGIFVALYPLISYYRVTQWLPVAFPGLMIIVLPVTSYLRYGLDNLSWGGVLDTFSSIEFSSLQVLNDGGEFLRHVDWGLGLFSSSALLIFVPRSVWADKNTGTGQMVAEIASYPFTNIGISPHFDAYLDFGAVGVAVMALAAGFVFRRVHLHSRHPRSFGYAKADLSALIIALMPVFVRGDFSVCTIAFYSFVLAYVLVRLLSWAGTALTSAAPVPRA